MKYLWLIACLISSPLYAADLFNLYLPNLSLTPGVIRHDLTQDQMCKTKWGKDHRAVTQAMKIAIFKSYGYVDGNANRNCPCEIDHLVSRELLGADDVKNLWPQSYRGPWNAHNKDRLENQLHKLVCSGKLTLAQAQSMIVKDWITAYKTYIK